MPVSLFCAWILSYGAVFLAGMFVGSTTPQRQKKKNIREYQRAYEEEMRSVHQSSWDHPTL